MGSAMKHMCANRVVLIGLIFLTQNFSLSSQDSESKPISILLIGNSYISYNNLPKMLNDMIKSKGREVFIGSSTVSGFTIDNHMNYSRTNTLLKQRKWDYIIFNENSILLMDHSRHDKELYPGINQLKERQGSIETKLMMLLLWANKNGIDSAEYNSYEKMQNRITDISKQIAKTCGIGLIPVGLTWAKIQKSFPTLELWQDDNIHPKAIGTYIAACVIYSEIFKESLEGSEYYPDNIMNNVLSTIQKEAINTINEESQATF
jgi:hypothetical protein